MVVRWVSTVVQYAKKEDVKLFVNVCKLFFESSLINENFGQNISERVVCVPQPFSFLELTLERRCGSIEKSLGTGSSLSVSSIFNVVNSDPEIRVTVIDGVVSFRTDNGNTAVPRVYSKLYYSLRHLALRDRNGAAVRKCLE